MKKEQRRQTEITHACCQPQRHGKKKIAAISRALPGTERNRTRLNAPATATPAPRFPFTNMMTI